MSDYKMIRLTLGDDGKLATGLPGWTADVMLANAEVVAKTTVGNDQLTLGGIAYNGITGICTDYSGNIYGACRARHCIVKIEESGRVSWVAGSQEGAAGDNGTLNNVPAADALFRDPVAIACDKYGTLYIVDETNNQIRTIKGGKVNVLAGSAQLSGLVDGPGETARFNNPQSIAVDRAGVVWVADMDNYALRKITNDGNVLTVAGNGSAGNLYNVQANNHTATLGRPNAVTVDQQGNVYISDIDNNTIRKYTANGWLYRYSGSGNVGRSLGLGGSTVATCSQFTCSYTSIATNGLAADASGNVYVVDHMTTAGRLLKLDRNGVPAEVADWNGNSYHGPYAIAVSPAQVLFVVNTVL